MSGAAKEAIPPYDHKMSVCTVLKKKAVAILRYSWGESLGASQSLISPSLVPSKQL